MPAWIHDRAEHLLAKNPKMTKSQAFAISTQQGHKLGKNPKGYGTKRGKRAARKKYDKPRKEYVKTPNPKGLESPKMASVYTAMTDELWQEAKRKEAADLTDNPYLLDKMHVSPKVRPRRAEAPEPKHRVKLALQQPPGVFGMPSTTGKPGGMDPAKQLANSQKVGVPKLQAPKMKTMSMKMAMAVSQFSGTLGGGTRDIYRPSDVKYGGPPPPEERGKKTKKSCGYSKMAAMADELAKLNGVATTPKGKLYQSQRVGSPKVTAPAGPSISELSKPVGYGTKAPGAVKGSI
jgi:hypothetical protein